MAVRVAQLSASSRTMLHHAEMLHYATFITLFYLCTYINMYMDMCVLHNRIFDANFFQILTLSVIISVDCCFVPPCTSRRCSTRNISIDYASSNFRSLEVVIAPGERSFFSVCSICIILRNACNLITEVELTRSIIRAICLLNWIGWYS